MRKQLRLVAPLALLLALSVVLSACAAGQQVSAADVIQNMRNTMKNAQSAQGVVDLSVAINKDGLKTLASSMMPGMTPGKMGGQGATGAKDWTAQLPDTAATTLKVWRQAPDKGRVEVQSASLPGVTGATIVYDGQKVYAYDPAHNTVYTATPAQIIQNLPPEIQAALQGLNVDQELDKVLNATNITLVGTEQVNGIEAYKLTMTPKPDAAQLLGLPQMVQMQAGVLIKDATATIWVDKDRWIPLKLVLAHPNLGTFTYSVQSMDLNKPIDSSQFVLQVPPGAKTVDLDAMHNTMQPKSTTLPEARSAATKAGWKLLEPTYPSGLTLVGATQLPSMTGMPGKSSANQPSGMTGVTLSYSSASVDFILTQAKTELEKQLGDGFSGKNNTGTGAIKEITVRGAKAVAFSPEGGNWTSLMWQEKGTGVFVALRGKLSVDEAVKIAEGLK